MKPLDPVDEEDGPWDAPLAALNHLFPFQLARAPLRWIPRAGAGERFSAEGLQVWRLVVQLIDEHPAARAALAELDAGGLALLERRWWRGLGALIAARAEALGLELAEPVRPALAAHAFAARRRWAAIQPAVLELVQRLERAGVETAVTKGLAHAQAWYPEPWSRPVGDLDLVVRAADEDRARAELERAGATPTARSAAAFRDHHHGVPLRVEVDGHPLVCELHTRLGPDDPGGALLARALADRRELATEDGPLAVLAPEARLAHAALHHTAELDAKGLLDLLLASRREPLERFERARALLPRAARWRLDLAVGVAADLGERPELLRVLPPGRRRILRLGTEPGWGRAQAAHACRAGARPRPRHWLAPWRPAVDLVVRHPLVGPFPVRQAIGCGFWLARQGRLVGRLVGDATGFVFPPRSAVAGSYVRNSARAAKSLVARALAPLRRRRR